MSFTPTFTPFPCLVKAFPKFSPILPTSLFTTTPLLFDQESTHSLKVGARATALMPAFISNPLMDKYFSPNAFGQVGPLMLNWRANVPVAVIEIMAKRKNNNLFISCNMGPSKYEVSKKIFLRPLRPCHLFG